jgi:hypothetical protein
MIEPTKVATVKCSFLLNEVDVFEIKNFLTDAEFARIREFIEAYIGHTGVSQNGDRRTIVDDDGRRVFTLEYYGNRPFRLVWNLGHTPKYWQQNPSTINEFFNKALRDNVHPLVYRYLMKCKNEIALFQGDWLPIRCVINVLGNGLCLDIHGDGNFHEVDLEKPAQVVSTTLYMRLPAAGGKLFFSDGFMMTPEENSLVMFDGQAVLHGVSETRDPDPNFIRVAMTTRWCRIQDLLFPTVTPMLYPPTDFDAGM